MASTYELRHLRAATRRALAGIDGALKRLYAVHERDSFVPLAEYLWWAISTDDLLSDRRLLTQSFHYRSDRNNDTGGQVVAGLRYARNADGHSMLTVTRTEGGLGWPATWPISFPPIVSYWMDADDVPPPDRPSPTNRRAYEQRLARQPVRATAQGARDWLAMQVQRLDHQELDE